MRQILVGSPLFLLLLLTTSPVHAQQSMRHLPPNSGLNLWPGLFKKNDLLKDDIFRNPLFASQGRWSRFLHKPNYYWFPQLLGRENSLSRLRLGDFSVGPPALRPQATVNTFPKCWQETYQETKYRVVTVTQYRQVAVTKHRTVEVKKTRTVPKTSYREVPVTRYEQYMQWSCDSVPITMYRSGPGMVGRIQTEYTTQCFPHPVSRQFTVIENQPYTENAVEEYTEQEERPYEVSEWQPYAVPQAVPYVETATRTICD